jgi:hypothetical protein
MKTSLRLTLLLITLHLNIWGQNKNSVHFSNISIDTAGLVKWSTTYTGETGSLYIIIERFVNNKWVLAGGFGTTSFPVGIGSAPAVPVKVEAVLTRKDSSRVKFHEGINRYRVRMVHPSEGTSPEFQLISKVSNDDGTLWIAGGKILLEKIETYEIIDHNGATVKKGEEKTVDISALAPGNYFFYTKTSTRKFVK